MAKSTRSKVKRHFRAKKREEGIYAATAAARIERLSSKLAAVRDADKDGYVELENAEAVEGQLDGPVVDGQMDLDGDQAPSTSPAQPKKISTHGPRGSRREEWRTSKGMVPRPKSKGMNRQGGVAAKRKAGRAHRRR